MGARKAARNGGAAFTVSALAACMGLQRRLSAGDWLPRVHTSSRWVARSARSGSGLRRAGATACRHAHAHSRKCPEPPTRAIQSIQSWLNGGGIRSRQDVEPVVRCATLTWVIARFEVPFPALGVGRGGFAKLGATSDCSHRIKYKSQHPPFDSCFHLSRRCGIGTSHRRDRGGCSAPFGLQLGRPKGIVASATVRKHRAPPPHLRTRSCVRVPRSKNCMRRTRVTWGIVAAVPA
eukprot:366064-Chlamydomonas_euryale.AAC.5